MAGLVEFLSGDRLEHLHDAAVDLLDARVELLDRGHVRL